MQFLMTGQKAVIVPLWKNMDNKREYETCRGTSLLNPTGKIYGKITTKRLRHIVDPQLRDNSAILLQKRIYLHRSPITEINEIVHRETIE